MKFWAVSEHNLTITPFIAYGLKVYDLTSVIVQMRVILSNWLWGFPSKYYSFFSEEATPRRKEKPQSH